MPSRYASTNGYLALSPETFIRENYFNVALFILVPVQPCELAEPNAGSLIESLRAFGYSLPTAIADLVDNSLTAGATTIEVHLHWSGGNSAVAILDNGAGMSPEELVQAMRPGSLSPLEQRDPKDLGRFGLGLKTASFSQCRRLTVRTKANASDVSERTWDLDHVGATGEWRLVTLEDPVVQNFALQLDAVKSGTLVVWQLCDRIVSPTTDLNDDKAQRRFLELADDVAHHLALVFHRFMDGVPPVSIAVNGNKLKSFDPFLQKEKATQLLTEETLRLHGEPVIVRPFVLPHHSKMERDRYDLAGGRRGWTQSQGFYVYRNKRLLVDGDWLGLGLRKDDHYKLARIQIDIPNTLDAEWQIDVRKARATPPAALRESLRRLAELTRTSASNIYRHRGARLGSSSNRLILLWDRRISHGKPRYELNREHPAVKRALTSNGCTPAAVESMLRLIEETVPIPTITIDVSDYPDQQREPFEHTDSSELVRLGRELTDAMIASGAKPDEAAARLSALEPFNRMPHVVQTIMEEKSNV